MSTKKPANAWIRRHLSDPYVRKANEQGYRSRAAFKLIELDERDRLLRPGMTVVDLGAAPGGWSQVAASCVGTTGKVIAVDLAPIKPIGRVITLQGDLRDAGTRATVVSALSGKRADLVMSDMAPNLSGVSAMDEARAQELMRLALSCVEVFLSAQGSFLVKAFHGSGLDAVINEIRVAFAQVAIRKPRASRSQSSEIYVVATGRLGV
jgi:23S rRNA (uridine2552-2'-O)-methyltransferase